MSRNVVAGVIVLAVVVVVLFVFFQPLDEGEGDALPPHATTDDAAEE